MQLSGAAVLLALFLGVEDLASQAVDTCPEVKLVGLGGSDKLTVLRGCPGVPGAPGPKGEAGARGERGGCSQGWGAQWWGGPGAALAPGRSDARLHLHGGPAWPCICGRLRGPGGLWPGLGRHHGVLSLPTTRGRRETHATSSASHLRSAARGLSGANGREGTCRWGKFRNTPGGGARASARLWGGSLFSDLGP
uniref:Uncharacterized protein n=1 Tax=Oryctolagus cuniculus TaxID=9986 RepID=G1U804_RABIT